ncbi:MAG TPA: GNAT family N-acetyltransferase [Microthrixaceae bacterium]|nr:GNAT family N-acetyltransferase [Microthrixaceae bacterium]HNI34514.1 GNAT family N-acetyltransferase [Microthrixaceae bacterium]
MSVRSASAEELVPLRREVLRDGRDDPPATNPADGDPSTVHLAAIDPESGEVIGCVSVLRRFRGVGGVGATRQLVLMAVDPEWRSRGVGSALVRAAQDAVDGEPIWAAARTKALRFYERHGFVADGRDYVGPMGLPHRLVVWDPEAE